MTTLANIRAKVRRVTARPSVSQITDDEIDAYVNTFYLYDLPEVLRLLNLKESYYFTTQPNIDTYAFDRHDYVSVGQPAYCNGQLMTYSQDPGLFFRSWSKSSSKIQVSSGDGGAGPYVFTIAGAPFLRSDNTPIGSKSTTINVTITANTSDSAAETAYDDGVGGFLNAAGGAINYTTGVTTITFNNVIPASEPIYAQIVFYTPATPSDILFSKDKFILRPVPDGGYLIQLEAYRTPTALAAGGDSPELLEWWQLLAYGAALKIFTDHGDFDQYQVFRPFYEEQLLLMQRRTLKEYAGQRAATIYSSGQYVNTWPNY